MDFTGISDDDLVARNQALGRDADAIRAQRIAINAELARRAAARQADQLLDGLRPEDVLVIAETAAARAAGQPIQA